MPKPLVIIGLIMLIGVLLVTFLVIIPQKNLNTPEKMLERVKKLELPHPSIEIIEALFVAERIVVQGNFKGANNAPNGASEWHQLAQRCAEQIYDELDGRQTVEFQLFQEYEFRAVAIIGLP